MKNKEEISIEKAKEALGNKDFIQTKKYFEELANQGNVSALCNLGIMHLKGDGVAVDPFKAKEYFLTASRLGYVIADYYLGVICEEGRGCDKDEEEAVKYFLKVADQAGNDGKHKKNAQYRLGVMLATGRGVQKNMLQAEEFLYKAGSGETEGHKGAQFYLGMLLWVGGATTPDGARALECLTKAAAEPHGHTEAQYCLGRMNQEGHLGKGNKTEIDENKARAYFLKAAEKGHKDAQYRLGVMLKKGQGGNRDEAQAIEWLSKAAKRGHTEAESLLCQYADNCGIGAESTSREMPKLIEAATQALGEEYEKDLQTMFHELWHIGIPELKDEVLYHYEYEMYPSLHSVPVNKQAGIVYLYVEQGILHYQVLKHLELCSGALNVEEGFNLDRLKDVSFSATPPLKENIRTIYYRCNHDKTKCIYEVLDDGGRAQVGVVSLSPDDREEGIKQILLKEINNEYCLKKERHLQSLVRNLRPQIIENGHLQPSYEDTPKVLNAYNEIMKVEDNFLKSFNNLVAILESAEFKEICKEPAEWEILKEQYMLTVRGLRKGQSKIAKTFKEIKATSSSEVINTLKKAYTDIDFKAYYNMVIFIQSLHAIIEQKIEKEDLQNFHQKYRDGFTALELTHLPTIFTAQFMTRRIFLLNTLASHFRKRHDEFYQLETVFFLCNKLAAIANRAQPQLYEGMPDEKTSLEVVAHIRSKMEKNEFKLNCFKLIIPIFNLLMLEGGQLDTLLIPARFYLEKRNLANSLSELKTYLLKNGDQEKPEFIFIVEKIAKAEKEVAKKNDLASIIACISHLVASIPADLTEDNRERHKECLEQPQEVKLFSPKEERRVSRMGNFFGMLSPRQGLASPPLNNQTKDDFTLDDLGAKQENTPITAAMDGRIPLECNSPWRGLADAKTMLSPRRTIRAPSLPSCNNRKNGHSLLAESCSGISAFSSPLYDLRDERARLSSHRGTVRIPSLPLDDNKKKGHAFLAESSDSINRFNRKNSPLNNFSEDKDRATHRLSHGPTTPIVPLSVEGKVNKSPSEDGNKKSGFALFNKLPSPRMRRQSKPGVHLDSSPLARGIPRCNSMLPTLNNKG